MKWYEEWSNETRESVMQAMEKELEERPDPAKSRQLAEIREFHGSHNQKSHGRGGGGGGEAKTKMGGGELLGEAKPYDEVEVDFKTPAKGRPDYLRGYITSAPQEIRMGVGPKEYVAEIRHFDSGKVYKVASSDLSKVGITPYGSESYHNWGPKGK